MLSQDELQQFCQRHGISGGYVSTSARTGEGLADLLDLLKSQIPWDKMTATVTTVTFKRIKEYILSLKENPERRSILVRPMQLRQQLQTGDSSWEFTDAEMMTAVKHLENHGYVAILHSSSGEESILLIPELLVDLASSIVIQATKHPRELGALSETALLKGDYRLPELANLEQAEQYILLGAAVVRFLTHNICFRETLGSETLLIFPGLITQKRPLLDNIETVEDTSYIVRGRVENVYAALVVLLGYTQAFTRINQWQHQAQYEMGEGEICGFRLVEEREGEIELVLLYSAVMPNFGRNLFQGLLEKFLYQREVEVTRFPPSYCPKNHRQERATVIKRLREGKKFLFCEECGEKISLPEIDKPLGLGARDTRRIQHEEALSRLRSIYETHLVRVKGFRRDRSAPRCYISHVSAQAEWAAQLAHDLRDAGALILEDRAQIQEYDHIIIIGTAAYRQAWEHFAEPIAADAPLIRARLSQDATQQRRPSVIPLLLEGDEATAFPLELRGYRMGDFRNETRYVVSFFDLVLTINAISFDHPAFEPLRESLQQQWEQIVGGLDDDVEAHPESATLKSSLKEAAVMNYHDFQVRVTADRKIHAASEQGEEQGELRLEQNQIELAMRLIEQRQTNVDLLKGLGSQLYQALFPPKIHGQLRATMAGAEAKGSGVRLRLVFEAPELAALPWEFLYDGGTNTFLANNTQTALSRYIDVPLPRRDLKAASGPIKILLIVSSPTDLPQLDVMGEERLIREALAKHINDGHIVLDVLREATIRNINQKLREKSYNVFHFIGHGVFENDKGFIALRAQDGTAELLDEERFAGFFLGNRSLGVVVLNACEGASTSSHRVFAGIAPNLVQRGIPAVVAMQYSILDTTAKLFADEFYRTLTLGWPVDAVVQTTRNAISMQVGLGKRDFATPVLYMRAKDGVILETA